MISLSLIIPNHHIIIVSFELLPNECNYHKHYESLLDYSEYVINHTKSAFKELSLIIKIIDMTVQLLQVIAHLRSPTCEIH